MQSQVNYDEPLLHVVAGAVDVEAADEAFPLQLGDAVRFPGDLPHAGATCRRWNPRRAGTVPLLPSTAEKT